MAVKATTINNPGQITYKEAPANDTTPKKKKLGGAIFWMIGGAALIKDLIADPLLDFIISAGMGLTSTAIGATIGLPLAAVAFVAKTLYTATLFFAAFLYFSANGGVSKTIKIYRFALQSSGSIIEMMPVVGLLPWTTTMFFLIAFLENKIRSGGKMGKIASMLIEKKA